MSGVTTLLLGEGGSGAAPGGTLGALAWTNIYGAPGTRFGMTNTLTISGITGSLTLGGVANGPVLGSLMPVKNGVIPSEWQPAQTLVTVTVSNGDTLAWAINNFNFTTPSVSGTVTVTRQDTLATIDTFTYLVNV